MSGNEIIAAIQKELSEGETYHGAFTGIFRPSFGWHLLLGAFSSVMMKTYIVGISNKKLYFAKKNLLGHCEALDGFEDFEIRQLTIKKNLLPGYTFKFHFNNDKKLTLNVPFRKQAPNALPILTPELLTLLQERFKCFS